MSQSSQGSPSVETDEEAPADNAASTTQNVNWVRQMSRFLPVVMLAIAVYGGMLAYADSVSLGDSLAEIRWSTVGLALLLSTLNFAARFLRWQLYLRHIQVRIPVLSSALVFLSGFAMTLTPAKAGEVLKSALLKGAFDVPIARSGPIVIAERITDLAGLAFLTALGCTALPGGWTLALLVLVGVAVLLGACSFPALGRLLLSMIAKLPLLKRFVPKLSEAHQVLLELMQVKVLAGAFAASVAAWGLQCLCLYVVANGIPGVSLSLGASLFIYAAPLIAGTVTMLPGGLGVTEVSMTGLLVRMSEGMTAADSTAVTLLVRLCALWWGLLVGLAAYAAWRLHRRGLPPIRHEAQEPQT